MSRCHKYILFFNHRVMSGSCGMECASPRKQTRLDQGRSCWIGSQRMPGALRRKAGIIFAFTQPGRLGENSACVHVPTCSMQKNNVCVRARFLYLRSQEGSVRIRMSHTPEDNSKRVHVPICNAPYTCMQTSNVCTCIYVCMFIYIHTHTHKHMHTSSHTNA
jgi:hypothetical protein